MPICCIFLDEEKVFFFLPFLVQQILFESRSFSLQRGIRCACVKLFVRGVVGCELPYDIYSHKLDKFWTAKIFSPTEILQQ